MKQLLKTGMEVFKENKHFNNQFISKNAFFYLFFLYFSLLFRVIWLHGTSSCAIYFHWTWLLPSNKGTNLSPGALRPQKFQLNFSVGFLSAPPLTLCMEKYFSRGFWDFIPSLFNNKCLSELNELTEKKATNKKHCKQPVKSKRQKWKH